MVAFSIKIELTKSDAVTVTDVCNYRSLFPFDGVSIGTLLDDRPVQSTWTGIAFDPLSIACE